VEKGFAVVVLGAARAGHLNHLPTLREWRRRLPNVVELFYVRRRGEHVDALLHNGNAIGHVVFRWCDAQELENTWRALTEFDPA
jgi:hypothetical protein